LTSGILLASNYPEKRMVGFDSFSGFPLDYDERDEPSQFLSMQERGIISAAHLEKIQINLGHLRFLKGQDINSRNISLSGDFSGTNLSLIQQKAEYLNLKNLDLIDGPFNETMRGVYPGKLAAVLLDCDLYKSYEVALSYTWDALSPGGMIYLDEYYSLKFPGARLATLDFFEGRPCSFHNEVDQFNGFERWWVIKDKE
jgi:hypothetical protein